MEILLSCLALFLLSIGAGKLLSYGFTNRDTKSIQEANQENEQKHSVFLKKYKEADMDKWQTTTRLLGFALALTFLLVSAETFTKHNKIEVAPKRIETDFPTISTWIDPADVPEMPPPPEKQEVPPPKPPEIETIIEVEDVVEDTPEIEMPEIIDKIPMPALPVPAAAIDNPPPTMPTPASPPVVQKQEDDLKTVIHGFVSNPPTFNNGINDLRMQVQKSYRIPRSYKTSGEKGGSIVVRFVVLEDGTIGQIEVVKSLNGCDTCAEEAIKAIKNIKGEFTPGKQAGKPVKVWFTLPIIVQIK